MSCASFLDLPLEATTLVLQSLDTVDRVALASTCTTLRKHGAATPKLWTSLQLQLHEDRLLQLAAWLETKSSAVHSLSLGLQLTHGDWPALTAALEPLTTLTSLQLSAWRCNWNSTIPTLCGYHLRKLPLRRLSVHSGYGLYSQRVDGLFRDLSNLESLELGPGCDITVPTIHLPPSLTRLSLPLELPCWQTFGNVMWQYTFAGRLPALRDFDITCRWGPADPDDDSWGPIQGSLDLGCLRWLAPNLEGLAVNYRAMGSYDRELTLGWAERMPPGLRSLTVLHLCPGNEAFLHELATLEHLTRLSLPRCSIDCAPAHLQGLTQLQELQLEGCSSRVVGSSLAPLRGLPRLRRLSLACSELWGLDPAELEREQGWPELLELDLTGAKLPPAPVEDTSHTWSWLWTEDCWKLS